VSERALAGIFTSLAVGAGLGLLLVVNLLEPDQIGNRLIFFVLFFASSAGLLGLLAQWFDRRSGRYRPPQRALQRGGVWAVLLLAGVVLRSEGALNAGNAALLLAILGVTERFVWNRK